MSEWEFFKIKDIGEVITGSTPSTKNREYYNGNIPFYSPADFHGTVYCNKTEKSISKEALLMSRAIPENAIMFACIASVGKIAISSKIGITNQQINTIVTKSDTFYYKFIYYLLFLNRNKFIQFAPQTTIPIINKSDFSEFSFNIPTSLLEQQKIARILSTVDAVIEKTEAAIAKYKAIKAGMMHDLFTRGIADNGQLRPAYEDAPHHYKPSKLGWIPKEWNVVKICEASTDGLKNGYFKKPELVGSGYKLINVSELYQPFGINIFNKKVERVFVPDNEYKKYSVSSGDIFFTRSSLTLDGIAQCNIILDVKERVVFECHVMRLRPQKNIVFPIFLALYCRSNYARSFFMGIAKQVTMTTISQSDIEKLDVVLPDLKEQRLIIEKIESIDKKIELEQTTLNKYQKLKQGLMQDLLTGKVTVSV